MTQLKLQDNFLSFFLAINTLSSDRTLAKLLFTLPNWSCGGKEHTGRDQERLSFLGALFRLNTADDNSITDQYFSNIRSRTQRDVDLSFTTLRMTLSELHRLLHDTILNL